MARPANSKSAEDAELLATGEATKAQIAKLFRRDPKTLDRLLYGLIPAGDRRGAKTYSIEEAAGRLVRPSYEIETYIRRMNHADIPVLVAKEFWNGLRARQQFEIAQGDLWPTAEVVKVVSQMQSQLRMTLLLMADAVERETSLDAAQRAALKRMIDGAIKDLGQAVEEAFKDYTPPDDGLHPSVRGGPNRGLAPVSGTSNNEEVDLGLLELGGVDNRDGEEDFSTSGSLDGL